MVAILAKSMKITNGRSLWLSPSRKVSYTHKTERLEVFIAAFSVQFHKASPQF